MYDFDFKKIGKRIRYERKQAGFTSQIAFAEALHLGESSRQTICKWENGKLLPSLDHLLDMCKLFHCEIGYLLCEYDCKTKENTDIHQVIGLSENAIAVLKTLNHENHFRALLNIINQIIEHDGFFNLLKAIYLHKLTYIDKKFSPSPELRKSLAKELVSSENEVEKTMELISESTITSSLLNIIHNLNNFNTNH